MLIGQHLTSTQHAHAKANFGWEERIRGYEHGDRSKICLLIVLNTAWKAARPPSAANFARCRSLKWLDKYSNSQKNHEGQPCAASAHSAKEAVLTVHRGGKRHIRGKKNTKTRNYQCKAASRGSEPVLQENTVACVNSRIPLWKTGNWVKRLLQVRPIRNLWYPRSIALFCPLGNYTSEKTKRYSCVQSMKRKSWLHWLSCRLF